MNNRCHTLAAHHLSSLLPDSRDTTICGNVLLQCFGCTCPPTHRLDSLHSTRSFIHYGCILQVESTKFCTLNKTAQGYLPAMHGCYTALWLFWNICISLAHFCLAIPWSSKPCLKRRGFEKIRIDPKFRPILEVWVHVSATLAPFFQRINIQKRLKMARCAVRTSKLTNNQG